MAPPAEIFDLVERVIGMRQAGALQLAALLGGSPEPAPERSNAYYAVWTVAASPPVRAAELRLPRSPRSPHVIVVDLDTGPGCLTLADLIGRYGEPPELSAPTSRQPPGSPTYYVYRQAWGDLRFGVDPGHCVASFVVDAER